MLNIENLHKSYATPQGPIHVLTGISLSLQAGESMALMGESGSGKSTLLHLIAGLDAADTGIIQFNNQDLTKFNDNQRSSLRRKKLGLIFQQFNLIPSMTIADNLSFQARLSGRYDPVWTRELTERLGLETLLNRYPEQLSGGQQQRVAIGRTLASKPEIVLADEPTGNLDETTGDEVLALTLELVAQTHCSFLMVTHSSRLAHRLKHLVTLKGGKLI
ncbi:MAG: ABC transporter ATP-binding protein [Sneathiella sp.]|nr:ABC transporter ATP-binding protein [Sneathiella sp.]